MWRKSPRKDRNVLRDSRDAQWQKNNDNNKITHMYDTIEIFIISKISINDRMSWLGPTGLNSASVKHNRCMPIKQ